MNDLVHVMDCETYPNAFTYGAVEPLSGKRFVFEISWRKNELAEFLQYIDLLRLHGISLVGFNNQGFDYPVLHHILEHRRFVSVETIYEKAMSIINTSWENRFSNVIWDQDCHVPQIDLFKIHHFDNSARATSLKVLEFNMRMDSVEDLPFPPGTILTSDQIDTLIEYMWHDIDATKMFHDKSLNQINFRRNLSKKYDINMMNFNDTKIGKNYFISELERHTPGCCYNPSPGKGERRERQTRRSVIHCKDIIFNYIQFDHPEFQRIHNWFLQKSITNTKGDFKVSCVVKEFQFDFGSGGLHGSIKPCTIEEDDDCMILDIDVTSYYPKIGIENRLFPAHLSEKFCDIYNDVFEQRKLHKKGSPENAMLKLALNGVYGDSNSDYSPMHDPQYTMSITINGQLLLCMLAEKLLASPEVMMIQANTDGITIKFPRILLYWVREVMHWWEGVTSLDLEEAEYSRFFTRDCNNYVAEYTDGKVKRKGAYSCVVGSNMGAGEIGWHQNQSSLVIQKAANARLLHGTNIRSFIENHTDIFDFLLRTKVPRTSKLVTVDYHGVDTPQQNVSRYYVAMFGEALVKLMPALPSKFPDGQYRLMIKPKKDPVYTKTLDQYVKHKDKGYTLAAVTDTAPDRRISINADQRVSICNNICEIVPDDIEYRFYENEAHKLVDPIINGGVL